MKIAIVNGPNLNLLGEREPEVYGLTSFEEYIKKLRSCFIDVEFSCFQSNVEGELINFLHQLDRETEVMGVLLNAGGYTHTSVALADAVAAISLPVVELHISNIFAREDYRHVSFLGKHCAGSISGFGMESYRLGVQYFLNIKD